MLSSAAEPAIDWRHVAHAVVHVDQEYVYTYSEPVRDLQHRLMLVPPRVHADQRLLGYEVGVDGTVSSPCVDWGRDEFGNRLWTLTAERVDRELRLRASYQVERWRSGLPPDGPDGEMPPIDPAVIDCYREPPSLTQPNRALEGVADHIRAASARPGGRAYRAHHWAAAAIVYRAGVTGVETTATEALARGAGVCQDFTHVLLALLRLLEIPARYVSGHLLGERAPHAWVEALIPDETVPGGTRIVAYDPTNRRERGLDYVTVAVGRDFADVTPTSGRFTGGASSRLACSQTVRVVEADGAPGQEPDDDLS